MKLISKKSPFLFLNIKRIYFYSIIASLITPTVFMTIISLQFVQNQFTLHQFLILLSVALLIFVILQLETARQTDWSYQQTVTFSFLGLGMLILMYAFQAIGKDISNLFYITPIAAYPILIKHFINERFAMVSSVFIAIFGSYLLSFNNVEVYQVFLYLLLSQWFAIFLFQSIKDRKNLFKTSTCLFAIHVLLVLVYELNSWSMFMAPDIMLSLLFSFLSVLFAVILTLGILPIFEAGFNMLTESKLLTLSNPNHPLLRKLLVEAPGTYHHSVMVANLSESACEAIGANGLLARVAAYYHDVGKALKPHMFIENQNNMKNPHDSMPPENSAQIILQHPYDGAHLLKEHDLPVEIIDIAEQHHGTTLLKYFYHKAKERHDSVKELEFRYDGPIPQTKEAAIINICDSVEAAVRSKEKPTNEEINKLVRSIIYDRLMDGQFNDSQLTLRELLIIEKDICDMLNGIFHARIEYPNDRVAQTTQGGQ
ncbi:HDIG domain-containing protein [Filobacillus milosensis]|uniref:HDIG domain-containing protein n=1 Tax=Filobacillus milosensis TaxID=94137 RepID=A0A4Y8ISG1_9BACI|nr:HDIG domain-containing metalloprotein [Filobacillus milosensis]TFB24840.1 HDIG domain-containing protein [Filobacillus milosensis]